eukprot:scaffold60096_cov24-Prasinocladus_malaysianus.AAC.1
MQLARQTSRSKYTCLPGVKYVFEGIILLPWLFSLSLLLSRLSQDVMPAAENQVQFSVGSRPGTGVESATDLVHALWTASQMFSKRWGCAHWLTSYT